MKNNRQNRYLANLLLILQSVICMLADGAHAANTDISDIPMLNKNVVGPNIMFALDDSGSMMFEILPESGIPGRYAGSPCFSTIGAVYAFPYASGSINPNNTGAYGGQNYFGYSATDGFYVYGPFYSCSLPFESTNRHARYMRTARFNTQYYNPAITYAPWSNADGTPMANASPSAAYHNPFNTAAGSRNLTTTNTATAFWPADDANGTLVASSKSFYPATYFVYTGTAALTGPNDANNTAGNFQLVEIRSSTNSYTKAATRTDCAGSTCTYAEEIQNFANWYQYYRSRILSARAGVGKAFSKIGASARVGYATINTGAHLVDGVSTSVVVRGVRPFDDTNKASFYSDFYNQIIDTNGTPLRTALNTVGQYFQRTDDAGPWGQTPGSSGGTQYSCRPSYTILTTDGYWNDSVAPTLGNVDNTSGPTNTDTSVTPNKTYTYPAGNPFGDAYSNTLADVAMYYWKNDLRSGTTGLANRVPTSSADPAFWQHMVTYTVGLGVLGTVSQSSIDTAFTNSRSTSPPATAFGWPDPTSSDAAKVDDLAHAAVNGHGAFFSAANPTEFANALAAAVDDISTRASGAGAVAVSNPSIVDGDNIAYNTSYDADSWTGDLKAFNIDLTTGLSNGTSPWTAGSAQAQLDALATPATSRKIITHNGNSGAANGITFQSASLTTAGLLSLLNSPSSTDGAAVLAWLRGDRSGETAGTYRKREHLLGDIIGASPVVVSTPQERYADNGFSSFKTANATRTKLIYQGANDGMLHVFSATTGAELWAYVPNLMLPSLNNLSRKTGFAHKSYVDATPVINSVDMNNTVGMISGGVPATPPSWKTLLVGGFNKGGRGYYALDATDASTPTTEASITSRALWEFPNNSTSSTAVRVTTPSTTLPNNTTTTFSTNKIGYSFGKPFIVKTKAYGWVVLVTSGYNNGADTGGDGHGYLFVLNARTGALLHVFDTGVGASATPSGLAQLSPYLESPLVDATTDYVYGGDMLGNVWRFNLTNSNAANWSVALLATLKDAAGTVQPITTAPELAKITVNSVSRRMVYVGTGRYLGDSDVPGSPTATTTASQTQTIYGLVDDLATQIGNPVRTNLVGQTVSSTQGASRAMSTPQSVNLATKRGWYIDLSISGERVNIDPLIALTTLAVATNVPSADACVPGGSSYLFELDLASGTAVLAEGMPYLGNALTTGETPVTFGGGNGSGGGGGGPPPPNNPPCPKGTVAVYVKQSDGSVKLQCLPGSGTPVTTRRVSWRELPEQ